MPRGRGSHDGLRERAALRNVEHSPNQDRGRIDVLADVAYPVTLAVVAELLDVGVDGAQLFAEQTPTMARMLEIDASPNDLMASAVASTEVPLFLIPILAERRQHPGADFINALLNQPAQTACSGEPSRATRTG